MSSPIGNLPTNELLDPATVSNPKDPLPQVIGRARFTTGWQHFMSDVSSFLQALTSSGTTTQRPTTLLYISRPFFDTTIGKPIWYNGTIWVKSDGTPA